MVVSLANPRVRPGTMEAAGAERGIQSTSSSQTAIEWRSRFALTPYMQVEFFCDDRFDVWNRKWSQPGLQWTVHRRFMVEVYYPRQRDRRSSPTYVNARGSGAAFLYQLRKEHFLNRE